MRLSRRLFGAGLVSLVSAGLARAGAACPAFPSAARLEADLAARLVSNRSGAVFTVTAFAVTARSPGVVDLGADIRLDWEPGVRTTRLSATAPTAEAAYAALSAGADAAFVGVVPGYVAALA